MSDNEKIVQFPFKCCKCGESHFRVRGRNLNKGQSYCKNCHNLNMRLKRPKHSNLREDERIKANVRTLANVYQKRGKIKKDPCYNCFSEKSEKHHFDYKKPLSIVWLCRKCHLDLHHGMKEAA